MHIRKKQIGKIGGRKVMLVDGNEVRNRIDIDFVSGGNPARYGYVPDDEIWIEKSLDRRERAPTILHEVTEERLMRTKGLSYGEAHDRASATEARLRRRMGARGSSDPVRTVRRFRRGGRRRR